MLVPSLLLFCFVFLTTFLFLFSHPARHRLFGGKEQEDQEDDDGTDDAIQAEHVDVTPNVRC
jgi:hypothetical protein